jgi:chorismate synthase
VSYKVAFTICQKDWESPYSIKYFYFYPKIQAYLAHAMLSIPATKGFEFGSGFEGTKMKGS